MTNRRLVARRTGPRTRLRVAMASALLSATAASGACLLADPVPAEPAPALGRPAIVGGAVVPATSAPLRLLPDQFQVPIQIADPRIRHFWRVFIDYDPLNNDDFFQENTLAGTPTSSNLQVVPFSLDNRFRDQCHRIEFVVSRTNFVGARGVSPSDSDSIAWFYVPRGRMATCVPYDGSADDGSFPDAADDAGDATSTAAEGGGP